MFWTPSGPLVKAAIIGSVNDPWVLSKNLKRGLFIGEQKFFNKGYTKIA